MLLRLLSESNLGHRQTMGTKNKSDINEIASELYDLAQKAAELATKLREVLPNPIDTPNLPMPPRTGKGARLPLASRPPINAELQGKVRRMISDEPLTLRQLVERTGVDSDDRIKVIITDFKRDPDVRLVNLGKKNKALWYIPSKDALKRLQGDSADE